MKNLILLLTIMLSVALPTTAQSTFYATTDSKSVVEVQDLTTGFTYSFKTKETIFVNVDESHDYLIVVESKQGIKHFLVKDISANTLDDQLYDVAYCEGVTIITSMPDPFEEEYYESTTASNITEKNLSSLRE